MHANAGSVKHCKDHDKKGSVLAKSKTKKK